MNKPNDDAGCFDATEISSNVRLARALFRSVEQLIHRSNEGKI